MWLAGFLHMEKREWKEAEDTFKELRKEPGTKTDLYAMLAQGAIPLNSLSSSRRKVGGNSWRSPGFCCMARRNGMCLSHLAMYENDLGRQSACHEVVGECRIAIVMHECKDCGLPFASATMR